jgi:quinol monooxygenase YgiN
VGRASGARAGLEMKVHSRRRVVGFCNTRRAPFRGLERKSLEAGAVSEFLGIARFKFHEDKLEEYKRLSAQAVESMRTKDSGTLKYEIYLNDDQSECMVVERYKASEALIEHTRTLAT